MKYFENLNPLLMTDFYKTIHHLAYVPKLDFLWSYWTMRKSRYEKLEKGVVFGHQATFKKYLIEEFNEKFGNREKWTKGKKWTKKANQLVKFVFKAGVSRSTQVVAIGDETTAEKYVYAGSASVEADAEYDVLAPYWESNGTVVHKGVIR